MSYKEKDMELWKNWKKKPTDSNAAVLLHQVNPLVQKEVNKWSGGNGTLARPALELEGKRLAMEAIHTFRPTGGAALGTHVTNRLRKLSRINYTHQNLARLPEYKTRKFHTHNVAKSALEDRLGREPTVDELSSELKWAKPFLQDFQKSMRKEHVESGVPAPIFDLDSGEKGTVDFVYNDLSPTQKTIFEHTTGYGGVATMRNPQLMKKLKMTQGQLSYQKRLLVNRIHDLTGGGIEG
jgi:DNA-directed RNA polymerase specialized sigma subunit